MTTGSDGALYCAPSNASEGVLCVDAGSTIARKLVAAQQRLVMAVALFARGSRLKERELFVGSVAIGLGLAAILSVDTDDADVLELVLAQVPALARLAVVERSETFVWHTSQDARAATLPWMLEEELLLEKVRAEVARLQIEFLQ